MRLYKRDQIGGVMVSVLASSAVNHEIEPWSRQRLENWYLLLLCYTMQHKGIRTKTGWPGFRIMCLTKIRLPSDCFSELVI